MYTKCELERSDKMSEPNIIGTRIRTLRGDKTMKAVADDLGISVSALGMYETGRRIPRDEVKVRMAEYFNTSVEAIFFAA